MSDKLARRKRIIRKISREQRGLFEHGICFSCGGKFLLNPACEICVELERLLVKQLQKILPVREIGPTQLSKEIFNHKLHFNELLVWVEREREFDCRLYDKCLQVANVGRWKSFTCRWCKLRGVMKRDGNKLTEEEELINKAFLKCVEILREKKEGET